MKRLFVFALTLPALLGAQGVRVSGVTTMQFVELRPLVSDSLAAAAVPGTAVWSTRHTVTSPAVKPAARPKAISAWSIAA